MAVGPVENNKLGRETLKNQFLAAIYDLDRLSPDECFRMKLEKCGGTKIQLKVHQEMK
jgi:hypothetical protein